MKPYNYEPHNSKNQLPPQTLKRQSEVGTAQANVSWLLVFKNAGSYILICFSKDFF